MFNLAIFFGISLVFIAIYSNIETLNEVVLWIIKLGSLIELILFLILILFLFKIAKNLKFGLRGLNNGYKLISILIFLLFCFMVYQNPMIITKTVTTFEYDTLNPFNVNFSSTNQSDDSFNNDTPDFWDIIPEPEITSDMTHDIEQSIFELTNERRISNGLSSLSLNNELSEIARNHSIDMAKNDFFSHENLDGQSPTDRAEEHGINIRKPTGGGSYMIGIGENIGMMPTGDVIGIGYVSNDAESVAEAQVTSWMQSPGHRANILDNSYDWIGVGVAYDGTYYYCTQDFQ